MSRFYRRAKRGTVLSRGCSPLFATPLFRPQSVIAQLRTAPMLPPIGEENPHEELRTTVAIGDVRSGIPFARIGGRRNPISASPDLHLAPFIPECQQRR